MVYIGVQGQTNLDSFIIVVWDLLFDPQEVFIDIVDGATPGTVVYEVEQNLTAAATGKR